MDLLQSEEDAQRNAVELKVLEKYIAVITFFFFFSEKAWLLITVEEKKEEKMT